MIAVLDASAAVATSLALPSADRIGGALREAELVLAPDLFVAECCNAFRKYRKAGILPEDVCETALERALALADQLESSKPLHREAYAMACRHAHPVYDTIYLTLARREVAVVFTLDRSLAALAKKLGIATTGAA
jgi:predicted nucleic acid-binding protein